MSLRKLFLEATFEKEKYLKDFIYLTSKKHFKKHAKYLAYRFSPNKKMTEEEKQKFNYIHDIIARNISEELMPLVMETDPTNNGKYSVWLVKKYFREALDKHKNIASDYEVDRSYLENKAHKPFVEKYIEDMDIVKEYLQLFHDNKADIKRQGGNPDIMSYDTRQDLFTVVRPYRNLDKKEHADSFEDIFQNEYYPSTDQADIITNSNDFFVVVPLTLEASKFYACFSEWCTRFPDQFENYNNKGKLFIIIDKKLKEKDPNKLLQLFIDYDLDEVEPRDSEDEWSGEEVFKIYKDRLYKDIDEYLINHSSFNTPNSSTSNSKLTNRMMDDVEVGYENGKKFVKFESVEKLYEYVYERDGINNIASTIIDDIITQQVYNITDFDNIPFYHLFDHLDTPTSQSFDEKIIDSIKKDVIDWYGDDRYNKFISEAIEDNIETFEDFLGYIEGNADIEFLDEFFNINDVAVDTIDAIRDTIFDMYYMKKNNDYYNSFLDELIYFVLNTYDVIIKTQSTDDITIDFEYAIEKTPSLKGDKNFILDEYLFKDNDDETDTINLESIERHTGSPSLDTEIFEEMVLERL